DAFTFVIVSGPGNGTLSGMPPNLTYTPDNNYNGDDSLSFLVNDGIVNSENATIDISVTPVNDPPVAFEDITNTKQNTMVTIDVISNDTDVDGTIDPNSITIIGSPSNGSIDINGDGTVSYTPTNDFIGTDAFTYTVQDDNGALSNEAMATITVREPVERVDLDRKIKEFKEGTATEEEVKDMIRQYME
ncbi:MAG: tandem-95 repeat protein, partial [bacterium]